MHKNVEQVLWAWPGFSSYKVLTHTKLALQNLPISIYLNMFERLPCLLYSRFIILYVSFQIYFNIMVISMNQLVTVV